MPRGNDFSPLDPTETITDTWDFGPWLSAGITISAPVTVCTVLSGVDAGSAGRLIGSPVVGPSPTDAGASRAILQQAKGMVGGVLYLLLCTVNTSDNQVLTLYAHQLCQVPA
jgi:hypothetical protein